MKNFINLATALAVSSLLFAAEPAPEIAGLEKAAMEFVIAYNERDAAALSVLFTEEREIVSLGGEEVTTGRASLKALFEERFVVDSPPSIAIEVASVRIVAPGLAIEDGTAHYTRAGEDAAPTSLSYIAVLQRNKEGAWLIASSRVLKDSSGPSHNLVSLASLMNGDWTAQGKEGVRLDLASGPGWGWDTMSAFYDVTTTYDKQLRTLEEYAKASSDRADVFFLLGYHYMVTGHMPESNAQFVKAAELQPADTISAQLRDLTGDSIATEDGAVETSEKPDPVPLEKLVGTWTSETSDGKITFTMVEGGDDTWTFGENELKGMYGLNDQGLLVLTADDSQMVSVIDLKDDTRMHFNLVGTPDGYPGLDFQKS